MAAGPPVVRSVLWRPRAPLALGVLALTALLTAAALYFRRELGVLALLDNLPLAVSAAIGAYVLTRSPKLALFCAAVGFACVQMTCLALILVDRIVYPSISSPLFADLGIEGSYTIWVAALIAGGVAMLQCRAALEAVTNGAAAGPAVLRTAIGPALLALFAWLASRLMPLVQFFRHESGGGVSGNDIVAAQAMAGAGVAAIFCFLVVPVTLSQLSFGEAAIARANRAHERMQRLFVPLEFLLQPRWALSATGIAAVLFALIFFDRERVLGGHVAYTVPRLWRVGWLMFPGTVAAIFLAALIRLRSWRLAFAGTLAALYAATAACWLAFHTGLVPALDVPYGDYIVTRAQEMIVPATALFAGLVFLLAAEDMGAMLSERGDAVLCIALMALIACIPTPALFFPVAAAIAAFVLMPIFSVALHSVFPRYRSVEEVFGKR